MQHKINLNGKTVLFVGLPKEASDLTLPKVGIVDLYFQTDDKNFEEGYISVSIPQGFKLIGVYPELTEEMAKMVVDLPKYGCYFNYNYKNPAHKWLRTALESFQSLIEREKLFTVNPYGDSGGRMHDINAFNGIGGSINGELLSMNGYFNKFNEAQQRTFPKFAVLIQR